MKRGLKEDMLFGEIVKRNLKYFLISMLAPESPLSISQNLFAAILLNKFRSKNFFEEKQKVKKSS
jgi:hypothetical protein